MHHIEKSSTYLERYPLEKAARNKQLFAYKHKGFWQCMDTKEIKIILSFSLEKERLNFNLKYNILVTGGTGFIGKHFYLRITK